PRCLVCEAASGGDFESPLVLEQRERHTARRHRRAATALADAGGRSGAVVVVDWLGGKQRHVPVEEREVRVGIQSIDRLVTVPGGQPAGELQLALDQGRR